MDDFAFLSDFYDEFVGADYDKIVKYIQCQLKRYLPQATHGADLGCGSGTLTYKLANLGYDMIGIDRSEAMLAQAAYKKREKDTILFLQQDMTNFELLNLTDFIVSSLDCVNYLDNSDEFIQFVNRCKTFLNTDGLLVFDFNTLYKYERVLDGKNFVYETEKAFCVWENEFDGKNMHYDLTYFINDGDRYKRLDEYQRQTYFTPEFIADALEKHNFKILSMQDDYNDRSVTNETERIVLTAQKGA